MKNKVLFTAMMLTATYGYSTAKVDLGTQPEEKSTIAFNRLGFDVNIKISPVYNKLCKLVASAFGFGAVLKYAPKVVTPNLVRFGLIATAGLYAANLYKNCSWTDLGNSCVAKIKESIQKLKVTEELDGRTIDPIG